MLRFSPLLSLSTLSHALNYVSFPALLPSVYDPSSRGEARPSGPRRNARLGRTTSEQPPTSRSSPPTNTSACVFLVYSRADWAHSRSTRKETKRRASSRRVVLHSDDSYPAICFQYDFFLVGVLGVVVGSSTAQATPSGLTLLVCI